jgi:hypothetical protein
VQLYTRAVEAESSLLDVSRGPLCVTRSSCRTCRCGLVFARRESLTASLCGWQAVICRGVAHAMLRNFNAAIADFTRALQARPRRHVAACDASLCVFFGGHA